jgi:uncharacterized protein (DUF305 family)
MIRKILVAASALTLAAFVAGASLAQTDHSGHGTEPAANTHAGAAEAGYRRAMDVMHQAMSKMPYSGNPDVDFVRGMIPHHQAAIDMAKVVIAHGKDPEIRKLAHEIVAAQEKEIDQMDAWLKANAPK